jgi:type II secretory pathway predicted ATPase ExeA
MHYMLPPERRLGAIMELVERGSYVTLHAGRQTGKTTSAQWLVEHYNAGDRFCAMWVDVQVAREQPDPAVAFRTVLATLDAAVEQDLPGLGAPAARAELLDDPQTAILRYLRDLAARSVRPLVVLVDEADSLVGAAMVSLLTQLRHGYIARRKAPFPHSIALIGQRTVRDYVLSVDERRAISWLGTASPFNVSSEALTLTAFTRDDVVELLGQRTAEVGQRFEPDAAGAIFELSQGQPWLVNALADQIVRRDVRDPAVPVTAAHVHAAKETLILERRTHIDSLVAKLREPRVRRIIDAMLAGDGELDMPKLMTAWQTFWRKDGHLAAEGFGYRESGAHLMLMAFLQRIVNGDGRVQREYGLGRGALDLMIEWRDARHAIEVKLRRGTETEADALEQVGRYLDHAGLDEGWLVMFDLRSTLPWTERLSQRTIDADGKRVHVVGC